MGSARPPYGVWKKCAKRRTAVDTAVHYVAIPETFFGGNENASKPETNIRASA